MWKADLPESVSAPEKPVDNGRTADKAAPGARTDIYIEETDQEKRKVFETAEEKLFRGLFLRKFMKIVPGAEKKIKCNAWC